MNTRTLSRNTTQQFIARAQNVSATLVMSMAVLVMGGWLIRSPAIVQLHAEFAPMQFNTAWGFLLAGLGLLPVVQSRRRLSIGVGVFLVLLGLATLYQYIIGTDLGIDELIVEPFTTVRTSHAGRMAPNTALNFLLTGLAYISMTCRKRGVSSCLGAVVLGLGLVSVLGYVSGLDEAFGWGDLTRMALHTSMGFVAVGTGITLNIVGRGLINEINMVSISMIVAILGLTCTVAMWQALLAARSRSIMTELERLVDSTATHATSQLADTLSALERLGERTVRDDPAAGAQERWTLDGTNYLDQFKSLEVISWFDDTRGTIWSLEQDEAPHTAAEKAYLVDMAARVRTKGYDGTFLFSVFHEADENSWRIVSAIGLTDDFGNRGVLVSATSPESLFAPSMTGMASILELQLFVGDLPVYAGRVSSGLVPEYHAESELGIPGVDVRFSLTATAQFVDMRFSHISNLILLGDLMVTGLMVAITLLAGFSWRAQNAFRYQYSRYQLVTNHVPAMIAAFDVEQRLTFANGPFVRWLKARAESDLLGQAAQNLLGQRYDAFRPHLELALSGEESRFELALPQEENGILHLLVQLVPHCRKANEVDNVFVLILDVTKRREAELQLKDKISRLDRFIHIAVGREEKMIMLKKEVNALRRELGQEALYRIVTSEDGLPEEEA